jgi:hypothetical protein
MRTQARSKYVAGSQFESHLEFCFGIPCTCNNNDDNNNDNNNDNDNNDYYHHIVFFGFVIAFLVNRCDCNNQSRCSTTWRLLLDPNGTTSRSDWQADVRVSTVGFDVDAAH